MQWRWWTKEVEKVVNISYVNTMGGIDVKHRFKGIVHQKL